MRNKLTYLSFSLLFLHGMLLFAIFNPTNALAQTEAWEIVAPPFAQARTSTEAARADNLAPLQLAAQADVIGFGRVVESESFWSTDGHRIESATTVKLTRQLKGVAAKQIVFHTIGGFIEEENLGMMRPHEASFSVGEEVVIFAESYRDGYRLVNGAGGKYTITGDNFLDHFSARRGSLQSLLNELKDGSHGHQPESFDIDDARSIFRAGGLPDIAQQYFVTSGHRKWLKADASVPFYVHLNTHQAGRSDGNRADFLQAIRDAADTWNEVTDANFTFRYAGQTSSASTSYNGFNEVVFMNKGIGERGAAAQVWYKRDLTLVEADIWINDDYDWNAKGLLDSHELDLQSVLLHEFGHWLVLGHLADGNTVMYPKLSGGTIKRTLHYSDEQGISLMYPCHSEGCTPVTE